MKQDNDDIQRFMRSIKIKLASPTSDHIKQEAFDAIKLELQTQQKRIVNMPVKLAIAGKCKIVERVNTKKQRFQ